LSTQLNTTPLARPYEVDYNQALERAKEVVRKWFPTKEDVEADVVLAAVLANQSPGPPVWLLVVGVPSSGKTTLLEPLVGRSEIYPMSSLTAKTFASGLGDERDDKDCSLLKRLKLNQILVVKDFGSIQSLRPDQKKEVLAQLREIYDGRYKKDFGTGKQVAWEGKLGIIGAVTREIDRDHSLLAALGERFLYFRPKRPDDYETAEQAVRMVGSEDDARGELAEVFATVLDERPDPTLVECPDEAEEAIIQAAIAAGRWRTPVSRDRQHNLYYLPEPESPARLAKQLVQVAKAVAALYGRRAVGPNEISLVRRLAHDSIPSLRTDILKCLGNGGWAATSEIETRTGIPRRTLLEKLDDLVLVRVMQADKDDKESVWRVVPEWTRPLMWWLPSDAP
jgi:hypothetical protein